MNAIGLNPIKLDAIGLDPIRMNAIRLGVPVASSGSGRPYIDPELLSHVKMAISTWGKTNDDPDRAVLKDLTPNGNDMHMLNFGFAGNSGYGLYGADFTTWTKSSKVTSVDYKSFNFDTSASWVLLYHKSNLGKDTPSFKVYINADGALYYNYINQEGILKSITIKSEAFETPVSHNTLYMGETPVNIGFTTSGACKGSITQLPDFEGWLCTDGVDDMIVSKKTVDEMIGDSKEVTVVSIIGCISGVKGLHNVFGRRYIRNVFNDNVNDGKCYICGYTSKNIDERENVTVINDILGDKNDFVASYPFAAGVADYFSVTGYLNADNIPQKCTQIAYAGQFIADKVLTTDEINQIIAYFNLDRPGQIIKPQLYYNIKKQGITNDNHAEFNEQLIDFVGGHNIQLNNIGWEGESGIIDGALYLDGINDFGKVTGLPVLKDYTVVADYERIRINIGSNGDAAVLSKAESQNNGAFMFNTISNNGEKISYSFGGRNIINTDDTIRRVFYQSKYINNGQYINIIPTFVDSDKLWLGTYRDNDTRFAKLALWSLMLFPYSLSEFLLERQLRKYKAGTLYPDMIEFRPVIKSNVPYSSISYSVNPGMYVTEGSTVTITITLSNETDKLVGVSSNSISDISISGGDGIYEITGKVTKSPQKINIVISSYLTMLNNETLISNETLIKNE